MKKEWKKKRRFRQSFARILQKLLHKPLGPLPYTGALNSIIILAQEKYGDAILLTPLLKLLKKHFPSTSVHVVAFSRATFTFFQNDRNIDTLYQAKGDPRQYYSQILSRSFDILFNTKDHPSSSFLLQSLIIRARKKIGIDCQYHRGIYDYLVDLDFHSPVALKNCGLLKILGKSILTEECRPYLPPMQVSKELTAFLESLPESSLTGINISAGNHTRYWTEQNWKKLVDAFPGERFLVFSSPEDNEQKKSLERQCPNIIKSPITANLFEAGLLVGKVKMLVTPDTAMVHVASCFNTPVLGLYGKAPQDQSRFKPFLTAHRIIVSSTSLIRDIPAETIIEALKEIAGN